MTGGPCRFSRMSASAFFVQPKTPATCPVVRNSAVRTETTSEFGIMEFGMVLDSRQQPQPRIKFLFGVADDMARYPKKRWPKPFFAPELKTPSRHSQKARDLGR